MRALWLVFLAGCQTSYLVGRGDAALERGEPDVALANYTEALARRAVENVREEVEGKRDRAALLVVRREIRVALDMAGEGGIEGARDRLWSLMVADTFGSEVAKQALFAAITELDADAWRDVETLTAKHHYLTALRLARRLSAPFPLGHSVHQRVAEVEHAARSFHTGLGAADESAAGFFHLMMAHVFGASPSNLERQTAALDRDARVRMAVRLDEARCPELARVFGELQTLEPHAVPVAVHVEVCAEVEKRWSETVQKPYRDQVPAVTFLEESYRVQVEDPTCEPGACTRHDALGICLSRPSVCEPKERISVRQVPVVEYREVTRQMNVEVHHRSVQVNATVRIADGEPFALDRAANETAFWSPDQQQLFRNADLSGQARQIVREVSQRVARHVGESRAAKAIALQNGSEAELVTAVYLARSVPPSAEQHFSSTYGLTAADTLGVIRGAPLLKPPEVPKPSTLVAAERDHDLDDFESDAVARKSGGGLKQLEEPGVDFQFSVQTSPLTSADRGHELSARVRFTRLHLQLSGQSPLLGGQAGGFGISLLGIAFDLAEQGFYFSWGLHYEQLSSDSGEKYRNFSLPIIFRLPITEIIWVGARLDPNFLFTKRIFDDKDTDPHFWSPISVWAVIDLQYAYLKVGAAHYLGRGFDDDVAQATISAGVRL